MRGLLGVVGLLVACWCGTAVQVAAVGEAVIVRGNKMYNSVTGERFLIKGMTYEYAVSDEYYDKYSKAVIEKSLKGLDFNTLRIYNVNPDASYKKFMNDMAKRGVYIMVSASPDNDEYYGKYRWSTIQKDLGPEGEIVEEGGIKKLDRTKTCYPALLLEYGKKIIVNFAQYDNTLAIIVANEVLQFGLTAAACLKQYSADLKNWMMVNANRMRVIPLAYAAADGAYPDTKKADYTKPKDAAEYHVLKIQGLLCGDTMSNGLMQKSVDIYMINEYRWCPDSPGFAVYEPFVWGLSGVPIVVAFGEYGCKEKSHGPRTWKMVPYMYDAPSKTESFNEIFSGGLAYAYGEAKLSTDSLFPMFSGGSQNPLEKPSHIPSADYENLKKMFNDHPVYLEKAKWDEDKKCRWIPELATTTDPARNERAKEYGWIPRSCNVDYLKVQKDDTWTTKPREGAICTNTGATCDVAVNRAVASTTQSSICKEKFEPKVGGGDCQSSADCGTNGQCIKSNGKSMCQCLPCYIGASCSIKDLSSCTSLTSSSTAPKMIFLAIGVFLGVMVVVFVVLAVIAQKKKNAMKQFNEQLKARAPGGTGPAQTSSM